MFTLFPFSLTELRYNLKVGAFLFFIIFLQISQWPSKDGTTQSPMTHLVKTALTSEKVEAPANINGGMLIVMAPLTHLPVNMVSHLLLSNSSQLYVWVRWT